MVPSKELHRRVWVVAEVEKSPDNWKTGGLFLDEYQAPLTSGLLTFGSCQNNSCIFLEG